MTDDEFYTVCFSGHRDLSTPQAHAAQVLLSRTLLALQEEHGGSLRAISGMARGVDQIAASICIDLEIPWCAAIPHSKYPSVYNLNMTEWDYLLSKAATVVYVVDDTVPWKPSYNFIRNQKMIDWSRLAIVTTFWNEDEITRTARPRGGTAQFLQLCLRQDFPKKILKLEKE